MLITPCTCAYTYHRLELNSRNGLKIHYVCCRNRHECGTIYISCPLTCMGNILCILLFQIIYISTIPTQTALPCCQMDYCVRIYRITLYKVCIEIVSCNYKYAQISCNYFCFMINKLGNTSCSLLCLYVYVNSSSECPPCDCA